MASGQRMKNVLKRALRAGARGLSPFAASGPCARILTYHSIGDRRYEMNVRPDAFAAQMAWLQTHVPVITLEAAAGDTPGVAITFDDGYRDNLLHAVPVLERLGLPATIFAVSGCLGRCLPFEREPESGQLLSEQELREVASRGIEIGGHTRSHPRLAGLPADRQRDEIAGCRADLEAVLGRAVYAFAYPYGAALDYDSTSEYLVREAGFRLACSNRFGPVDPGDGRFAVRRIWIDSTDTLPSFRDKVLGRLDLLKLQDSGPGIRLRRWLNRRLHTD